MKYPYSQFNESFKPYFVNAYRKEFDVLYEQKSYAHATRFFELNRKELYKNYEVGTFYLKLAHAYGKQEKYSDGLRFLDLAFSLSDTKTIIDDYRLPISEILCFTDRFEHSSSFLDLEVKMIQMQLKEKKLYPDKEIFVAELNNLFVQKMLKKTPVNSLVIQSLQRYVQLYLPNVKAQEFSLIILEELISLNLTDVIMQLSQKIIDNKSIVSKELLIKAYQGQSSLFMETKKWNEAISTYESMQLMSPDLSKDASYQFRLAELYFKVNKMDDYQKTLKIVQTIDGNGVYGRLAQVRLEEIEKKQ